MHASETVLLDALNRLGGRQDAPATTRDLIAAGPRDLPLVAVRADGPSVVGFNVEAFLARAAEAEPEALAALHVLVADGVLTVAADPGAGDSPATSWATADPRGGGASDGPVGARPPGARAPGRGVRDRPPRARVAFPAGARVAKLV